ncbi:MAG: threonylcarbamoyl-AMP synthase [Fimbriimonadaceae bacterium]|nr:threonylcarbamoyl-AMP synthase [Fimbriimonadaceae bacterium]
MTFLPATQENISRTADILRSGGLAIIPTETVYGIAAVATNAEAVAKIYSAKGRPADNPLIIHISSIEQIEPYIQGWTESGQALAKRYWPGPLTLVFKKTDLIPDIVTGGLDTVAVRMPSHLVAHALIEAVGAPLAAPSANKFMHLSATRVDHLDPTFVDRVDAVLDGGPCIVGLESTVVDVTEHPPRILRPGAVSRADIQAAIGSPLGAVPHPSLKRSPGLFPKHYSPNAPTMLVDVLPPDSAGLTFGEANPPHQVHMPADPVHYAKELYDALHRVDTQNPETIFIERPPENPEWEAVWDRIIRAAGDVDEDF